LEIIEETKHRGFGNKNKEKTEDKLEVDGNDV